MISCPACGEGAWRFTPADSVTECLCGCFNVRQQPWWEGSGFEWRLRFGQDDPLTFCQESPNSRSIGRNGLFFRGDWLGRLSTSEREAYVRECMGLCLADSVLSA